MGSSENNYRDESDLVKIASCLLKILTLGVMVFVLQALYIRVKRNKTTYFVQCDPTETILAIKQKLCSLIDQPVNDQRLILRATGDVLEDSKTLADQKVENDAVVALTLRKDGSEFEDVNIETPNDSFYSREDGSPSR
ncbi:hypothetical protein Scep_026951 [Stephania cephalantha]|uniref:Ubiquitin-like domain-containing protein n=1 Tax=Stephania cephalantha TaxID=152367 RepID=A0AAP0EPB1_9MAGN